MVEKAPEPRPSPVKLQYGFDLSTEPTSHILVGHFGSMKEAIRYAELEGFSTVAQIMLLLRLPLTKKDGLQLVENINNKQEELHNLLESLAESLNENQRDKLDRILAYTFDKIRM